MLMELLELPAGCHVSIGTQTEGPYCDALGVELPVEAAPKQLRRLVGGFDVASQTDGRQKPPLFRAGAKGVGLSIDSEGTDNDSAENYSGETAVPRIKATSRRRRLKHVREAVRHWYLERSANFCCPFHQSVAALEGVVDKLRRERCNPLWSTYTGAQCSHCFCMNEPSSQVCAVCGHASGGRSSKASEEAPVQIIGNDEMITWMRPTDAAVLRSFPVTPLDSCMRSLLEASRHWNTSFAPEVEPCCALHAAAMSYLVVVEHMDSVACQPCLSRCAAWSCPSCLAMNDEDDLSCLICATQRPRPESACIKESL